MCTFALIGGAGTQLQAQDSTAAAAPAAAPAPAAAATAPTAAAAPAAAAQTGLAASLGLYVFPAKGQTPEQQGQDEQACYAWSKEQSGIDPATVKANPDSAMKAASAKVDTAAQGAGARGAARGAAGGAVVGAIAGDAGEGAAIGAVVGLASGRKAKKQAKKQAEQQASQQANAWAAGQIDTFKKGMTACLEGKGDTVK
jgi:Glycine zipper